MRQIKFRAWDTDKKEMYTPTITSDGKSAILWYSYEIQGENDDVLMQYTGQKDKNGKEIYEFDLAKDDFGSLILIAYDTQFGAFQAHYLNEKFFTNIWETRSLADEDDEDQVYAGEIKVIGNIYENPELIK